MLCCGSKDTAWYPQQHGRAPHRPRHLREYSFTQQNCCWRTASRVVTARAPLEAGLGCSPLLYSCTSALYCSTRCARVATSSLHFLLSRCRSLGVATWASNNVQQSVGVNSLQQWLHHLQPPQPEHRGDCMSASWMEQCRPEPLGRQQQGTK
jgi:hypothetical protein